MAGFPAFMYHPTEGAKVFADEREISATKDDRWRDTPWTKEEIASDPSPVEQPVGDPQPVKPPKNGKKGK